MPSLQRATHVVQPSRSWSDRRPDTDQRADEALALAVEAADVLVRNATRTRCYRLRHQRQAKLDTALGCRLSSVPGRGLDDAVRLAFNAACVPLTWRSIEPVESGLPVGRRRRRRLPGRLDRNLRVFAGPLIDFSEAGLPDYVRKLATDPVAFKSLMCDYVETVVTRYRGKISRWLITSGANGSIDPRACPRRT